MGAGTDKVDLIQRHFRDLVAGDEAAVAALVHEDLIQDWPQTGERLRGRQACLNVVQSYPGGPPRFEISRISGEGDHWVVEGRIHYSDGSVYYAVWILEFRDGQIAREVDYFGPAYPAPAWRSQWVGSIEA